MKLHTDEATQDALSHGLPTPSAGSIEAGSNASSLTDAPATQKAPKRKRTAKVKAEPDLKVQQVTTETDIKPEQLSGSAAAAATPADAALQQAIASMPAKQPRRPRKPKVKDEAVEAVAAAVDEVAGDGKEPATKKPRRQRVKATELAVDTQTELVEDAPKRKFCFHGSCCSALLCARV